MTYDEILTLSDKDQDGTWYACKNGRHKTKLGDYLEVLRTGQLLEMYKLEGENINYFKGE